MNTVRTLREAGIKVSSNTVLRIIKKKKYIAYEAKNIGIDYFSLKKREIYNTIITDNDNHKKIEIINSRDKNDVVEVLKP